MTLIVSAYRRDPSSDAIVFLPPRPPASELAGFEGWRESVWGTPPMRARGLRLLASLEHEDVYAEGEELDALAREVDLALHHLDDLGGPELAPRLANIRAAVALARTVPDGLGGVYIG